MIFDIILLITMTGGGTAEISTETDRFDALELCQYHSATVLEPKAIEIYRKYDEVKSVKVTCHKKEL